MNNEENTGKGAAEEPEPEPDDASSSLAAASYDPSIYQRPHPDDRGGGGCDGKKGVATTKADGKTEDKAKDKKDDEGQDGRRSTATTATPATTTTTQTPPPKDIHLYLREFRVGQLQQECRDRGLPVGGLKEDLIRRIVELDRRPGEREPRTRTANTGGAPIPSPGPYTVEKRSAGRTSGDSQPGAAAPPEQRRRCAVGWVSRS